MLCAPLFRSIRFDRYISACPGGRQLTPLHAQKNFICIYSCIHFGGLSFRMYRVVKDNPLSPRSKVNETAARQSVMQLLELLRQPNPGVCSCSSACPIKWGQSVYQLSAITLYDA